MIMIMSSLSYRFPLDHFYGYDYDYRIISYINVDYDYVYDRYVSSGYQALEEFVIQSQERDGMHWRRFFPASRQENGFFEVSPVRPNFLLFTKGGCTNLF